MHPSMFAVITGVTKHTGHHPFVHLAPTLRLFYDTSLLGTKLIPLALTLGDTKEWDKEVGLLLGPTRSQGEDSFLSQVTSLGQTYTQESILTHAGFHNLADGTVTPTRALKIVPYPEPNELVFRHPLVMYNEKFNLSAEAVTLVCPLDPSFLPYFLEALT